MINITFDYDGCLTQDRIKEIAKTCVSLGYNVYILTSRFDTIRRLKFKELKTNEDIYQTAEEIGLKPFKISFTNQGKKCLHLLETGIHIHVDDNKQEVNDINYYGQTKAFNCNDGNFEEKFFEYIEAIKKF